MHPLIQIEGREFWKESVWSILIMLHNIMIFLIRSAQTKRLPCFVRSYNSRYFFLWFLLCPVHYYILNYFFPMHLLDWRWLSQNCTWSVFLSTSRSSKVIGANTLYVVDALSWSNIASFLDFIGDCVLFSMSILMVDSFLVKETCFTFLFYKGWFQTMSV